MRQTSLLAYQQLKLGVMRTRRYAEIIDLLRDGNSRSDTEISRALGYSDPNVIRPRRNELVKMKFIESDGKRLCKVTHKKVLVWKLRERREVV